VRGRGWLSGGRKGGLGSFDGTWGGDNSLGRGSSIRSSSICSNSIRSNSIRSESSFSGSIGGGNLLTPQYLRSEIRRLDGLAPLPWWRAGALASR